ncbi:MAG: hypothetical protein OXT01_22765, partial [Rhodospirillaceae bacterium]|nr:hypothetical protein [Rhodospirillaceae bacterium]
AIAAELARVAFEEAFELVEDGDLDETQFEAFTFGNTARLHTSLNPNFFAGTVVESAVANEFSAGQG